MIDLDLPEDDELERDLILLAQQQEKLLAELALAYEEESEREREEMESGRRAAFDQEMEARVKAMNLSVSPEEIEDAFEEVREVKEIFNEVSSMFETYLERFFVFCFYILLSGAYEHACIRSKESFTLIITHKSSRKILDIFFTCNYNKIPDRHWFSVCIFVIGTRSRECQITGVQF